MGFCGVAVLIVFLMQRCNESPESPTLQCYGDLERYGE